MDIALFHEGCISSVGQPSFRTGTDVTVVYIARQGGPVHVARRSRDAFLFLAAVPISSGGANQAFRIARITHKALQSIVVLVTFTS